MKFNSKWHNVLRALAVCPGQEFNSKDQQTLIVV
uniref:Clone 886 transcribed RNA sequence n=1 Tax=Plectreurys tristis TaxID=33319 RepID=A0A0C4W9S4_PLETR|nr:hypothetical protein [Plectreurys tristis]